MITVNERQDVLLHCREVGLSNRVQFRWANDLKSHRTQSLSNFSKLRVVQFGIARHWASDVAFSHSGSSLIRSILPCCVIPAHLASSRSAQLPDNPPAS